MSSMVDEPTIPPTQASFVCPCCIFSFHTPQSFIAHCEGMKKMIDGAIEKAKKVPVKK